MGGATEVINPNQLQAHHSLTVLQFADSRTAYDDLDQDMKQKLESLVANHSLFHSRKKAVPEFFKDTDPFKLPLSKHHLVQKHESSGRMVRWTCAFMSNEFSR